ncbi:conserved hypothetical protein [Enterococcus casseliflavus EC10]|uniref:glycosyltransferase family 4 protein n=3 Tax=Enterococcus casseliflavus TaxID=37734 RepID=UPI0001B6FDE2|nr:glycosyltransferase family 4 protein [Enterococcus casseliflavus]EEV34950.1 conserved hypothetical protein [Enterococcus casseliflavus EC10]
MKEKIVFIVNHDVVIYNFRRELIERLLEMEYEIHIFSPSGSRIDKLVEMGCIHKEINVNRHGTNILEDLKLVKRYLFEIKSIMPIAVLTYTIKPNIYGGIAANLLKVPYITNVTGLGNAIENQNFIKKFSTKMYSFSLKRAYHVFFQNKANLGYFEKELDSNKYSLLPGSGVNLTQFKPLDYPEAKTINFLFLARIMKEKGIEEYLFVAKKLKKVYTHCNFHVAGFVDGDYEEVIKNEHERGNIIYHGMVDNVTNLFQAMNCIVLPSYHEGMSNVLLEASASARPVIASNIPGCQEIIDDNETGFLCEVKNTLSLEEAVRKFIGLSFYEQKIMGEAARRKVESNFDRDIIIDHYTTRLGEIRNGKFISKDC